MKVFMKNIKRYISFIMFFLILCNCSILAFASSNTADENISIQEYEAAIQNECKKYDIECEILNYNPKIEITKKDLAAELDRIRKFGEHKKERTFIDNASSNYEFPTTISPRIMPQNKNVSGTFRIDCVYGWVNMKLTANITINVQAGNIMYINSYDVYPSGTYVNFDSYTLKSVTYTKDHPSLGWITFTINGTARFSYTDPYLQITTGYNVDSTETVKVDCN